jgi:phage terminase large subunit-like protein
VYGDETPPYTLPGEGIALSRAFVWMTILIVTLLLASIIAYHRLMYFPVLKLSSS